MSQAERSHSTFVSRRRFLATGTVAAASGAVVAISVAAAPAAFDPMVEVVSAYEDGLAKFNMLAKDGMSNEATNDLADRTYHAHMERMEVDAPTPTTMAGAIAAVRCVHREIVACGYSEKWTVSMLTAALRYFDGHSDQLAV